MSGISPDVVVGKNPTVALLFDMNRVFEAFIASRMRKVAATFGCRLRTQGPQRYLGEEQDSQKKLFLLRPDMTVIGQDGHAVWIGDTKWKLLDASDGSYGVSPADVYQMLAYGTQYKCQRLALVYPFHRDFEAKAPTIVIRRGGYRVEVWAIDISGLAGIGPSVESQLQMRMMEGELGGALLEK